MKRSTRNWQWALVPLGRNDFPVPEGAPGFTPPKQLPTGYTFQDAMRKLDQFLLTLRGPPNDGTYNLVLTCGNPDNSYGSATDYIEGNDVYDEAEGQEPSSTGRDFAKWLLALLFLLLLLALAAAAAAAAAALAGWPPLSRPLLPRQRSRRPQPYSSSSSAPESRRPRTTF